jgi:phosphoribosylanthranilate isomerase
MSKIKICGITRAEDIVAVNAALPDYIGFVFAKYSKRYVTPELAKELRRELSGAILPVGVFVDEPVENVVQLFENGVIELAQLHGDEDDVYVKELRVRCSVPIIKAVSVSSVDDIGKASESVADYLLFDNGLGGTGISFNWDFLSMDSGTTPRMTGGGLTADGAGQGFSEDFLGMDSGTTPGMTGEGLMSGYGLLKDKPFFLAGGIDLSNIGEALALKPYAIDVSSGAETNGRKDSEKIMALVSNVRRSKIV